MVILYALSTDLFIGGAAMSICMPSKRAYKTSQYIINNINIINNMFVSVCIFVECLYCLYFYL